MMRPNHCYLIFCLLVMPINSVQAQFLFGRLQPLNGESNSNSINPNVSANGKVIAFESGATNWVVGSLTGSKIIAFDLLTGNSDIVSSTSAQIGLNANSFDPSLSRSGRYISFQTQASNLGFAATLGSQVVRKDRSNGELSLVSVNASGVSASGSANGQARIASISGDGRFVAFLSDADTLVNGDANLTDDIFVKDMLTGALEIVSLNASGNFTGLDSGIWRHAISDDARFVVFQNSAPNMVVGGPSGSSQVYVRDRTSAITTLVSTGPNGPANSASDLATISANGRYVSFRSFATNLGATEFLSRVFVRDRQTNLTTPIPLPTISGVVANGCRESAVSDFGSVVYVCFFPNPFANQVFLYIPGAIGAPFLVSSDINDVAGNQVSGPQVSINASGLSMVFDSRATNLVSNDFNNVSDNFILVENSILVGLFADGFE